MATAAAHAPAGLGRSRSRPGVLPVLGGLLALYLLAPLVVFVIHLGSGASSGLPTTGLGSALVVSLVTATVATTIITVFGVPLAWVLARSGRRLWSAIGIAVQLPLALPPLMSGILLLEVVGPYTLVGRLTGGGLTDTPAAIVVAQTFVAAPFLVISARSAFAAVEPDLLDVARTLGHGSWSRFLRVGLPVAAAGIRAGMLLSWLRAFGEFGATVILAYHPYSLPVFTFVQFGSTGLPSALPPTGVALGAAAVVLTLVHLRSARRSGRTEPGDPAASGAAADDLAELGEAVPHPGAVGRSGSTTDAQSLTFAINAELGGFRLEVAQLGEAAHVALLGASGAGKSMTLRCLAGLRATAVGEVRLGGRDIGTLAPEARRVGWVPQDAALFPGLSVWRQVTFGVGADPEVAARWLRRLGLEELRDRRPDQLSGGQRQRVALVRALATSPELLLLDEPLSALDRPVREALRRELRRVQQEAGIATVLVTHDPEEAAMLAEQVIVLDRGRVLQSGQRASVFQRPDSARVARLLGIENVQAGEVRSATELRAGDTTLTIQDPGLPPGTPALWCVRAADVILSGGQGSDGQGSDGQGSDGQGSDGQGVPGEGSDGQGALGYDATVVELFDLGTSSEVHVRLAGGVDLTARTRRHTELVLGDPCRVAIAPEALTVWPLPGAGTSDDRDSERRRRS